MHRVRLCVLVCLCVWFCVSESCGKILWMIRKYSNVSRYGTMLLSTDELRDWLLVFAYINNIVSIYTWKFILMHLIFSSIFLFHHFSACGNITVESLQHFSHTGKKNWMVRFVCERTSEWAKYIIYLLYTFIFRVFAPQSISYFNHKHGVCYSYSQIQTHTLTHKQNTTEKT